MNKKRKQPCKNTAAPANENSHFDDTRSSLHRVQSEEIKPKRVTFESDVLREDLQTKFLCLFPDEFFSFWKHTQMLAGKDDDPCVFGSLKFLRLCGVFDYLAGHLKDADTEKCLVYDRFATDLPEMQTLAVYNAGRFVYWRDEPNTEKPLIVHVDNAEHFPKCSIVGAVDPFYMIAYLVGKALPIKYRTLFSKDWIEHYKMFIANVKTVVKSRKKETCGFPFHGIGIHVKIVNNIGYRPLKEKTEKLKDLITSVATTNNEAIKQKKLEKIMEIISCVQFANDEKDFGMGLEFGHDIFWSNYGFFDKMTERLLTMAYKLLNREAFARILKVHMPLRRC
uniref:Aprataxin and PNK-like factor PBZ domain-containing protein n=1 Tax=Onchocerca volvulus TaxID=6282 RepID=A0A8R1XZP2_ONCVO